MEDIIIVRSSVVGKRERKKELSDKYSIPLRRSKGKVLLIKLIWKRRIENYKGEEYRQSSNSEEL